MRNHPRTAWVLLLLALGLGSGPARAEDTWTTVAPGIEHLHRTAAGPQEYHVVLVDLTRPEIYLRATGPGENGQRTSSFAASVGATVAVNGDLWDANNWSAYEPLGLAVGEGWKWREDTDTWGYLACDPEKQCGYGGWGQLVASSPRWFNAIGGMQDMLVIDGVPQSYTPAYYNERNPRTATGVTQDGGTLILLVADGRRSGAIGMTFGDLTAVMVEFGAWNAMNHDGGGSSTLVIGGAVRNVPSDGGERVVANHLAILRADHTDPDCVGVENSKQCVDGHNIRTCTGGLDRGLGDCGYYGLTCENDGLFAYCVDPRCTQGGQSNFCLDETRIAFCEDGVYAEGDCAGFGIPCVEGFGTAWCWADFYQGTPVASSLGAATGGALTVTAGQAAEVWFELENTGLATWTPGVTKLAPMPRDADSPLAGPDWLSPTRAATVAAEVPPGQVGRFTFSVLAPAPGDYTLTFGLVQEAVTWFSDPPGGGGPADGDLALTVHAEDPVNPSGDAAVPSGDASGLAPDGGTGGGSGGEGCGCATEGPAPSLPLTLLVVFGLLGLWARRRRCGDRRQR